MCATCNLGVRLDEQDASIAKQRERIDGAVLMIADEAKRISAHEASIDALVEQVGTSDDPAPGTIQSQVDSHGFQLRTHYHRLDAQRETMNELRKTLDAHHLRLDLQSNEIINQGALLEQHRDILIAQRELIDRQGEAVDALRARNGDRAKRLDAQNAEITGHEARLDVHRGDLDTLKTEVKALDQASDVQSVEIGGLQQRVADLANRVEQHDRFIYGYAKYPVDGAGIGCYKCGKQAATQPITFRESDSEKVSFLYTFCSRACFHRWWVADFDHTNGRGGAWWVHE